MMIAIPQTDGGKKERELLLSIEFIEDEETIRLIIRRPDQEDKIFHLDADDDRWLLTLSTERPWNDRLLTATNGDFG
jgi:hypothetical protein